MSETDNEPPMWQEWQIRLWWASIGSMATITIVEIVGCLG